jgi:hypothetical protein
VLMYRTLLATGVALLMTVGAFAIGYDTAPKTARTAPIRLEHGVPVGVLDTPAGAVAAADNYVVSEDDALLSPGGIREVVDELWAPGARAAELAQPFPAAALLRRPATFAGLKLTAAVAASKLESYTPRTAQVGVWHEITVWSPSITPTQRWTLDKVILVWNSDRWVVASRSAAPDQQTPVPAWTSGSAQDRTSQAFDFRLAGMSAPYYEGPQP